MRFSDEILALAVDSSGTVERFGHTHSVADSMRRGSKVNIFEAEPQAVPSRDGKRVLWASNWSRDCPPGGCGPLGEVKAYVADATCAESQILDTPADERNSSPLVKRTHGPKPTIAEPSAAAPPRRFALLQNRPNPFAKSTSILFDLPVGAMVRLDVFDAQGRRVALLADRYFLAGRHAVTWDRSAIPGPVLQPGLYLYRLTAGGFRDEKRLVLLP
jgi:hypothetical protein